jgi:Flp pilus assembly pilin Flp
MNIVSRILANMSRLQPGTRGQGLAEYALMLALIAIIALSVTLYLGGNVSSAFSNIGNSIPGAMASGGGSDAPPAAPTAAPASAYSTKATCTKAGYTWVAKTKSTPAHCA